MGAKHELQTSKRAAGAAWIARLAIVLALLVAARLDADVTVAIEPGSTTVAPDSEFDVLVRVTQAGSAFNAFDAVIGYDPAALTLVPLSPISAQEGTLLTDACGNRFHRFRAGADRDTVTDVLLCSGVSVSSAGTIYRLRFQASATPQATQIQFLPGLRFWQAGVAVLPVHSSGASVVIGATLDAGLSGLAPSADRVTISPNPARGAVVLSIEARASGEQEVTICDVTGRVVRRLERGWFAAGTRRSAWDGRDEACAEVRPGRYWVRLGTPRGIARGSITRIR